MTTKSQAVQITVGGVQFTAMKRQDTYGVKVVEFQDYLGLSPDFTRNLKRGKSPEVLQEANIHTELKVYNVREGRSATAFIDTKDLTALVGVFARRGNNVALSWLIALANETLERRIDNALGESVTEETYEDRTKAFFRELSRKAFHPKFTTWNDSNVNYGAMVNEYKKYMSLPLVNIDQYNQQQISVWYEGIVLYNSYRYEGYCHKVALEKTRMILADCD